jgi:hypothetical protein
MNSMKLNREIAGEAARGGAPLDWREIERLLREGHRLRAEAFGRAFTAMGRPLKPVATWFWSGIWEEAAAERQERSARRQARMAMDDSEVTRGFFWPRLSWIAHEGKRWFGLRSEPDRDGKDQRAA